MREPSYISPMKISAHMYILRMYVHMYVHTYVYDIYRVCTRTYICMYTKYTLSCEHTRHTHAHMHTCTHGRTHLLLKITVFFLQFLHVVLHLLHLPSQSGHICSRLILVSSQHSQFIENGELLPSQTGQVSCL